MRAALLTTLSCALAQPIWGINSSHTLTWPEDERYLVPTLRFSPNDYSTVIYSRNWSHHERNEKEEDHHKRSERESESDLTIADSGNQTVQVLPWETNTVSAFSILSNFWPHRQKDPTEIVRVATPESFREKSVARLLKQRSRMFFVESLGSMVYNRAGKWYELRLTDKLHTHATEELIPVSGCMRSSNTSAASYTRLYRKEVHANIKYEGSIQGAIPSVLGITASLNAQTSTGLVYSSSFSCNFERGQYGQMFIQPLVTDVPEMEEQEVVLGAVFSRVGDLKKIPALRLMAVAKANHVCKSSRVPEDLQCGYVA